MARLVEQLSRKRAARTTCRLYGTAYRMLQDYRTSCTVYPYEYVILQYSYSYQCNNVTLGFTVHSLGYSVLHHST